MKRVVIESPYAGNVEQNVKYARACLRDALKRGEAPLASHLLYTQEGVLDDNLLDERALGISAGFEWLESAELQVFYTDYGWSPGMLLAKEDGIKKGTPQELRSIL